jgi:hypothetical protein
VGDGSGDGGGDGGGGESDGGGGEDGEGGVGEGGGVGGGGGEGGGGGGELEAGAAVGRAMAEAARGLLPFYANLVPCTLLPSYAKMPSLLPYLHPMRPRCRRTALFLLYVELRSLIR